MWLAPQWNHCVCYILADQYLIDESANIELWLHANFKLPPAFKNQFTRVVRRQRRSHGAKIDVLSRMLLAVSEPMDIIGFMDGDAFPVAPVLSLLQLAHKYGLVAIRRDECDESFPHVAFLLARADVWRRFWTPNLWRRQSIVERQTRRLARIAPDWVALTRVAGTRHHPVFWSGYGVTPNKPLIYHHGAGFRQPRLYTRTWGRSEEGYRRLIARNNKLSRVAYDAASSGELPWLAVDRQDAESLESFV